MFDKLGEELKNARKKKGISIQQLATKTRIDKKFLESIEIGDFTFLPELYVKAFIKEFAKSVDLDEEKIIKKYEAAKAGKPIEEPEPETEVEQESESETEDADKETSDKIKQEKTETPKPEKRKTESNIYDKPLPKTPPVSSTSFDSTSGGSISNLSLGSFTNRNLVFFGIVVMAVILIGLIYFLFIDQNDQIIVTEKPYDEVVNDNKERFEEENPEENTTAFTSDSLSLTIQATDTSWINIFYDDRKQEEFTLFPKSQKTIKAANNFKLTVGNAGGISFLMNNEPLDFIGKSGSVRYLLINQNGIQDLQSPPSLQNK